MRRLRCAVAVLAGIGFSTLAWLVADLAMPEGQGPEFPSVAWLLGCLCASALWVVFMEGDWDA